MIGRDIVADMQINHPVWESLPALTRILFRSIHKSPLPTLLRNYDRFSMASGIEIRMPFMDYRVICFGLSLPPISLFHEARTKSIIRDAINHLLPPPIMAQKHKIGWHAPMAEWIKGPLKPFIMDTIHSQQFKNSELIYAPRVQEVAIEFFKKDTVTFSQGTDLWGQIQPFLWEEGFFNVARKSPLTGL